VRLGALLLVAAGLIALAFFGDQLHLPLFGATPATPTHGPSAPPASPTPSPSPEAWRSDPDHPANLFAALMTSTDVSYHVENKVTVSYLTSQAALGETWDVSGADLTYSFIYNTPTGVTKRRAVRKGDTLYVKEGDKQWIEQHVFDWFDIWGEASPDAYSRLSFVGQETKDGATAYHVSLPVQGFPYVSTEAMVITGAPSVSTWDVWVDAAGEPLTASMHAGFNGVIERRSIPIQMDFQYTFSKVGDPLNIEVPAQFR
jgi:hypothetical protein